MYPRKNKQKPKLTESIDKHSKIKSYSDKEQDSKKKLIVIKILEDLKKRHKNFLELLNLTDKSLKQGLNILIKDENLLTFDYSKFLNKAEQELILNYVINSNSLNKNNSPSYFINNNIEENINNKNYKLNSGRSIDYSNSKDLKKNYNNNGSPKNLNNNSINYNNSNAKYEELKNVKEKDQWGILAKKDYMEYLEDKISKIQKKEEKKKEITEILAKQILEKNQQKNMKLSNEERFFDNFNKDVEIWKKSDIREKEKNENKIKDFIEKRDFVMKSNRYFF